MKSVAEAAAEILACFAPLGSERVALLAALGRFSAEPCVARHDSPAFDNSAMDGYALRAADSAAAAPERALRLAVRGESRAGGEPPPALQSGEAQRIFTGAQLPAGADAVELQENVAREGDQLLLQQALSPGANVRLRGADLRRGALLIDGQREIGAGEIALLASQEYAALSVHRRPRVAILCTGDELRDIGEAPRPGSIVNSNGYALAAQVLAAGAEPWLLPAVRDTRAQVASALREALGADVVVLSGGVSVGDYDVVRDALADAGVSLAFWKVRMKPGKPLAFAQHGRVPVLGLPGNPVSSWVTFELFVRPGLRKMLGDPHPQRPRLRVQLAGALTRKPGRTEFARARLLRGEQGFLAELLPQQGSGSLPSLVGVDALLEIDADCTALASGAPLEALLLRPLPG